MDLFREIKWAYQRVIRGYDDRVHWGFDSYFAQVVPALKYFCLKQLERKQIKELNPERYEIYTETLKLIADFEKLQDEEDWWFDKNNRTGKLFGYVGEKILWFWD